MEDYTDDRTFSQRFAAALDRTEVIYLRALRAIVLAVATVLILYAAWLGISGLYRVVQSPNSVVEKPVIVNADELTNVEIPEESFPAQIPNDDKVTSEQRKFYADFVGRYYNIFHKQFEPFRQPEDKQLSIGEFDDSFVQTSSRLDGIRNDQLDFKTDCPSSKHLAQLVS